MQKFSEKMPFFQVDMAGLRKYSMRGYGRIGVHRSRAPRALVLSDDMSVWVKLQSSSLVV